MIRRFLVLGLCAAGLACSPQKPPTKPSTGPVVAKGEGITITSGDFKARLEEQSPFIRARYTTLERKKEFLDNLVRFEVLAKEAERQGLANDPDVRMTLKKIMVQKLVQRNFQDAGTAQVPDADLKAYYDAHLAEYDRPKRVRVSAVILDAPAGSPERAKKLAAAQKALAALKAEEKKNPAAFARIVTEYSDDAASKAAAGDLQFKSREELEAAYSKELAEAAFGLAANQTSGIVQSPKGIYILKHRGEQPELKRSFDEVKAQIAAKLQRERKTKDFDEWLKGLREQAKVTVDEAALEAVEVPAAPAGQMGGHGMGGMAMPPQGAMPAPAKAPAAK